MMVWHASPQQLRLSRVRQIARRKQIVRCPVIRQLVAMVVLTSEDDEELTDKESDMEAGYLVN